MTPLSVIASVSEAISVPKYIIMTENFDYQQSLERLEQIAKIVEDPSTGIDDIAKLIKESDKIVDDCKEYLRSARG